MRCSNCGTETSSKFCPNCGSAMSSPFQSISDMQSKAAESQPFLQNSQPQSQTQQQPQQQQRPVSNQVNYYSRNNGYNPPPVKNSSLSVAAFISSFFCCFGVVGAILGIVDLVKANNEPVRQKHGFSIAAIVIGLVIPLISFMVFGGGGKKNDKTNQNSETTAIVEINDDNDDSSSAPAVVETTPATTEPESDFPVSSGSTGLSIGDIASNGNYYVGLACVRSLNNVQTAVNGYSEEISSGQEVIYPIIQVYNNSNTMRTFWDSGISVYADSIQGNDPDTIYKVGVDGIDELDSYCIDPGGTAVVITAFVVDEGWSELTIFLDDVSWTVTPDEISSSPYSYSCMFGETSLEQTPANTVVYSGDYELTYDGFEFYTYSNMFTGDERFAVFEFTVNNTSSTSLDYDLVGYEMRGYCNSRLLDDASYILDESINGYSNVYDVESVHAGMTSRVYVAFPILDDDSGVFECYYDAGYISNNTLAHVVAEP